MNTYNKADSVIKQQVREHLLNEAKNWIDKPISGLTLPNTNFWLEEALLNRENSQFTCYEYNSTTFKQANPPKNINYIEGDIFSVKGKRFNFVWLDYCNAFCNSIVNKTIEFTKNNEFYGNSVLGVTFCKAHGWPTGYENVYPNYKTEGFGKHLSTFLKGVKEVSTIEYACHDTSEQPAPMILYIFKFKN